MLGVTRTNIIRREVIHRSKNAKTEIACRGDGSGLGLFGPVESMNVNYLTKKCDDC